MNIEFVRTIPRLPIPNAYFYLNRELQFTQVLHPKDANFAIAVGEVEDDLVIYLTPSGTEAMKLAEKALKKPGQKTQGFRELALAYAKTMLQQQASRRRQRAARDKEE